jgi:hypothetical protein
MGEEGKEFLKQVEEELSRTTSSQPDANGNQEYESNKSFHATVLQLLRCLRLDVCWRCRNNLSERLTSSSIWGTLLCVYQIQYEFETELVRDTSFLSATYQERRVLILVACWSLENIHIISATLWFFLSWTAYFLLTRNNEHIVRLEVSTVSSKLPKKVQDPQL